MYRRYLKALALSIMLTALTSQSASASDHEADKVSRDAYEQRMSRQLEQYRAASSGRSFSSDLANAWGAVQRDWGNLVEATEENWQEAQKKMDDAWSSFEKNWDAETSATSETAKTSKAVEQ